MTTTKKATARKATVKPAATPIDAPINEILTDTFNLNHGTNSTLAIATTTLADLDKQFEDAREGLAALQLSEFDKHFLLECDHRMALTLFPEGHPAWNAAKVRCIAEDEGLKAAAQFKLVNGGA